MTEAIAHLRWDLWVAVALAVATSVINITLLKDLEGAARRRVLVDFVVAISSVVPATVLSLNVVWWVWALTDGVFFISGLLAAALSSSPLPRRLALGSLLVRAMWLAVGAIALLMWIQANPVF